jgi:hypothetical protein
MVAPAVAGAVQGVQEFDVVDSNGKTVGTFGALVSNTNSDVFGGTYVELLVED